jgi:hypothetical protein
MNCDAVLGLIAELLRMALLLSLPLLGCPLGLRLQQQ